MRMSLTELDGAAFDTVIIGGGINGASAAQHLTAAGYRVMLVEKGDFASGSTSRSTRILHCGLRYFETPSPLWDFALAPSKLRTALRMARQSMEMRGELAQDSPARLRRFTMLFPIHEGGAYRGWQVDLAFHLLGRYGPKDVPLNYDRRSAAHLQDLPFVAQMRDVERLTSVATFTEYLYDWPERICLDAVLDAQRMGATVRNYTEAISLQHSDTWTVTLGDATGTARVSAPTVLNMAGIWIDCVNTAANQSKRLIYGTKGAHVAVKLPEAFRDYGIATVNSVGEPHYCVPSQGGLHHIGPTETPYGGDPDDVRVDAADRSFLLNETRLALPGLSLTDDDIVYSWAGVRPLGFDPAFPKGKRSTDIHDLGRGMFALTGGPIMTHRAAGRALRDKVAEVIRPSQPAQSLDYAPRHPPENPNSPPFDDRLRQSDLVHAATEEQAQNLTDILFARTGAVYHAQLSDEDLRRAAQAVSAHLGWDASRIEAEVHATRNRMGHLFDLY
ncbi:MAG: FAD-dependent oxidoreductase [Pseudomonadota bacterium]